MYMQQMDSNTNNLYNQMIGSLQTQFQPGPPKLEITRVSGKPGADAFQMAPNSETLLLDTTQPIIWLAQTDGAGYKTLEPFDVKKHIEQKEEDKYKALEDRITRLEEKIDAKQSYSGTNGRKPAEQHNGSGNRSNDAR